MENRKRIVAGLSAGIIFGVILPQTEASLLYCIGFFLLFATTFLGLSAILLYIPMITLSALFLVYILKFVLTLKTGFGHVGAGIVTGFIAGYGLVHIVVNLVKFLGGPI